MLKRQEAETYPGAPKSKKGMSECDRGPSPSRVRSFSEAIAEEVKGTGVTVTAICPGPTATGFEKVAAMKSGSTMCRKAASAASVAEAGIRAMEKGKALLYQGLFTKLAALGARIAPRAVTRKFARKMNH